MLINQKESIHQFVVCDSDKIRDTYGKEISGMFIQRWVRGHNQSVNRVACHIDDKMHNVSLQSIN